jgi:hemolysin III
MATTVQNLPRRHSGCRQRLAYKPDNAAPGTVLREPFSAISHFVGACLSVAALVILLVLSHGRPVRIVSFSIYGATLILLFTASTLHHALSVRPRYARRLQRLDHAMIYLLILGSYTPICLLVLRGGWGWSLWGVECGLAVTGMALSLFLRRVPDGVRLALYLGMGWMVVIALAPLRAALTGPQWAWLVAGGLTYSFGAVIFAIDRPHLIPGKFHAHDLWHVFVLAGTFCHFILMMLLV